MQIRDGQILPIYQPVVFCKPEHVRTIKEWGRQVREVLDLVFTQKTFQFNLDSGSAVKRMSPGGAVAVIGWKNTLRCDPQCFHENGWGLSCQSVSCSRTQGKHAGTGSNFTLCNELGEGCKAQKFEDV